LDLGDLDLLDLGDLDLTLRQAEGTSCPFKLYFLIQRHISLSTQLALSKPLQTDFFLGDLLAGLPLLGDDDIYILYI
jgi:hypothetical protein